MKKNKLTHMSTVKRVVNPTPLRLLRTQNRPFSCSLTTAIVLINYNEQQAVRHILKTPEESAPYLDTESVSWVDVQGLGNEDILQRLGRVFKLHPLVLQDVMTVPQRPKFENYDDQQLLICRMVLSNNEEKGFHSEQMSIVIGRNYVLTVQEESYSDCFDPLRDRILRKHGVICCRGCRLLSVLPD